MLQKDIQKEVNQKNKQRQEEYFEYLPGYQLPLRFLLFFHDSNIPGSRQGRPQYIQIMVGYFDGSLFLIRIPPVIVLQGEINAF